ncbi:uncharacterized protein LOC129302310 [Prosopis cineraria]|uniref:uncharacterized protein LOC129302310 n=1 Tax=Prosopis cineraria TaxID=364024 RepID=UPI00240FE309|nr:uncharacterized protein LOC129302310 [Prosopis cineraria]
MISTIVMDFYLRFLYHTLVVPYNLTRIFAFICPYDIAAFHDIRDSDREDQAKQLCNSFKARTTKKGGRLFLIPYVQGDHWVLIALDPAKEKYEKLAIYYLCSASRQLNNRKDMMKLINKVVFLYRTDESLTVPRVKPFDQLFTWIVIRCPHQRPDSVDCGYCVMRFIKDIITHAKTSIFTKYYDDACCEEFGDAHINEVVEEWC